MKIIREDYPRITVTAPVLFDDNERRGRSGHLGHALVEYQKDCVLAFSSNTSAVNRNGHTMYGWVEYKRSLDAGQSWSRPAVLEYAMQAFYDGSFTVGCEKAVACDDGSIVLFCLRSVGAVENKGFEPYRSPVCLKSRDGGKTWSDSVEVTTRFGRIYDAIYKDGRIYVLFFANPCDRSFVGYDGSHKYILLVSEDNGAHFSEASVLPFSAIGHAYGSFIFRGDGSLVAYAYNARDEQHLTCCISMDNGRTWGAPVLSHVSKKARNPQVGFFNDMYFLHARAGAEEFVIYYSKDGQ